MVFTRSQASVSPTGRRPSMMDRLTGRTAGTNTTTSNTSAFGSSRRGVRGPGPTTTAPRTTGGGLFGKSRKRTTGGGPMPMSHHQSAQATTGDRVHGAARKAAGAIVGDQRKEASGEAMMHGGANPNTGFSGFGGRKSNKTGRMGGRTSGTGTGVLGGRSEKTTARHRFF